MQTKPNRRRAYLLTAGLLVCVAALVYEFSEIQRLENQAIILRARLDVAQTRLADLSHLSEKHERQISAIEEATGLKRIAVEAPSRQRLDTLQPGIYVLTTDTQYDPSADEATTYQITHVTLEMSFESFGTKLNIGLARSGVIPKGVYFDYDNDGQVDVDMARDFAREIPVVGRRIANAYDTAIAQNLYSIFVAEADNAEYTSMDDLTQQAEAASNYLWSFVISQYQNMEDWIRDKLDDSQPNI
ncbi:MAG: hypothetical protein ACE5FV_13620 [Woeseia sp.]